jgi:hypothetical protein
MTSRSSLRAPLLALLGLLAGPAWADTPADASDASDASDANNDSAGYTPPVGSQPPLAFSGYIDVGFAHAGGNGTSFAPDDHRLPLDYGSDAFAPAVNARGDVASTATGGRFTNHFLPRSMGIGSSPSFLLNTVDADVRFTPSASLLFFGRAQVLPRFSSSGDSTRVIAEQAFGRWIPFDSQEFAATVGLFDPVFGIEYLQNEANLRTGVTPSLIARYTTGQQLGAKAFYRRQIPAAWSAVSLNVAATNNSTETESLQTPYASLTGMPVLSGRLGYELNLTQLQVKLGASGLYGPRNDQKSAAVRQYAWGADARAAAFGFSLEAELVRLVQDEGDANEKFTGTGTGVFATGFEVLGFYSTLGYGFSVDSRSLKKVTAYVSYSQRRAQFDGFTPVIVDRFTGGVRLDAWDALAFKAEVLFNRELKGAPDVDNDVQTFSLVYSW